MLVNVAAEYTPYNVADQAELLTASEWNLRDIRLSVGDGTDITMFAAINTGWAFFNRDDMLRIVTDKWKVHMWNLLEHTMIQGAWTKEKLYERYQEVGPYDLTSLAGEPIRVDFDHGTINDLTVAGGDLFFPNIQGTDGLVHFATELPLPISVTHTVYDIAKENPKFSTQILYIDTVRLATDMKRLSPMTALYAPNEDWENVVTPMTEIAETVLKNHMFKELLWCEDLVAMAGTEMVTSLNNQNWTISVNDGGFPCFDAAVAAEGTQRACITKCDVLVRNGLVHELDYRMEYVDAATAAPDNGAPTGTGTDNGSVFQRPNGAETGGGDGNSQGGDGNSDGDVSFGSGKQSGATPVSVVGGVFTAVLLFLHASILFL